MNPPFRAGAVSREDGGSGDGIHLLWSPPAIAGYSVRGWDIQRRGAQREQEITCRELSESDLRRLHTEFRFGLGFGTVAFSLTPCPQPPGPSLDQPYRGPLPEDGDGQGILPRHDCIDFRRARPAKGRNPRTEGGFRLLVREPGGQRPPVMYVRRVGNLVGLDCRARLDVRLAQPADQVELTVVRFAGPVRAVAISESGKVLATATTRRPRARQEQLVLRAEGIVRVALQAPKGRVLLLELCTGRARRACVDLRPLAAGRGPNPREQDGLRLHVFGRDGQPAPATEVSTVGGAGALDAGYRAVIELPVPCDGVELTLVALGHPPFAVGYDAAGKRVAAVTATQGQGTPQTLRLDGHGITRVVLDAPEDRVALQEVCWEPAAGAGEREKEAEREGTPPAPGAAPAAFGGEAVAGFAAQPSFASAVAVPQACVLYDVRLDEPHAVVRVEAGLPFALAIALREGSAVDARLVADPGGVQHVAFDNRGVDEVRLYTKGVASSLRVCVDVPATPKQEEAEWGGVPYLVRGLQLPVAAVDPGLAGPADEWALAQSRLLPGESADAARFAETADLLNEVAGAADAGRAAPPLMATQSRAAVTDPFLELRSWPFSLALTLDAAWRRMLGFGWLDPGGALTPGGVYDYRITGWFRRRDVEERLLGFHTVPSGTTLPQGFHLGPLFLTPTLSSRVEIHPGAGSGALRETGRRGLALHPGPGGSSLTIAFPEPASRLVLELEPARTPDVRYEARTTLWIPGLSGAMFADVLPAARRVAIDFPEPVDTVTLYGEIFLYGIRAGLAAGADPDEVVPRSVVIGGVQYAPTPGPPPPAVLATANLQEAIGPVAPGVTERQAPQSLGFRLYWLPGGPAPLPWPPDLDAAPPLEVMGFELERRRLDAPTPWAPLDDEGILFFGNRGAPRKPEPLAFGVDLLAAFPETVRPTPPVPAWMDAQDVLAAEGSADPPPGSLFQYRVRAVDAIGRRSGPTPGSVVRLEKRLAPPQPVGPTTPVPAGQLRPPGVTARVLQASDPDLPAADRALLGASQNAVVLEWGWSAAERGRDPWAREFRVYWNPLPPDRVRGVLAGTAALSGGVWEMAATLDPPVAADELAGKLVTAGPRAYRIAGHGAGGAVTMRLAPSSVDPSAPPQPAEFTAVRRLDGSELRPGRWPTRLAVVPLGPGDPAPFVIRDQLVLDAAHTTARVWVGVTAADAQGYVADEVTTGPLGNRPGNESSVAVAVAQARYLGRPVFTVPPPLPNVPEQVADEPGPEGSLVRLDLPALLPAAPVPAGHRVVLDRLGLDELVGRLSAQPDDTLRLTLPDDSSVTYVPANPADRAALLAQVRSGEAARVENRFLMALLLGNLPGLERLWQRAIPGPVAFAPATDTLPPKAQRWAYRVRLADPAGHVSEGAAIVPKVIRVPSLRVPAPPELSAEPAAGGAVAASARVRDAFDLRWVVFFVLERPADEPTDPVAGAKPQLLRLPNRRDLYPASGIALRLRDGTLLAPRPADAAAGVVEAPDRVVSATLASVRDRRALVWAASVTRDGMPSRLVGPVTVLTEPEPLVVPALTVTAVSGVDRASWPAPAVQAEAAVERSTDGGATWTRVSPWIAPAPGGGTHEVPAPGGARQYRLALRASRGRSAQGTAVAPS